MKGERAAVGSPMLELPTVNGPLQVPRLTLAAVSRRFQYEGGVVLALDTVDLTIDPGSYLSVTGRSGSGKSTLLNVIGLLDRPTAGSYVVGDDETVGLKPRSIDAVRGGIFGLIFQSFHLVDFLTVTENVTVGLTYLGLPRSERDVRVMAAIESVGLLHRADARARTLSGGERQRVAIARTLARRPRVLLADEPTGNLDQANAEIVLDLFDRVRESGITLVVVTHDDETAERADARIHMRDGRIDSTS